MVVTLIILVSVETTTTKSVYLCIITQKSDLLGQIKQSLSDKSKTVWGFFSFQAFKDVTSSSSGTTFSDVSRGSDTEVRADSEKIHDWFSTQLFFKIHDAIKTHPCTFHKINAHRSESIRIHGRFMGPRSSADLRSVRVHAQTDEQDDFEAVVPTAAPSYENKKH